MIQQNNKNKLKWHVAVLPASILFDIKDGKIIKRLHPKSLHKIKVKNMFPSIQETDSIILVWEDPFIR